MPAVGPGSPALRCLHADGTGWLVLVLLLVPTLPTMIIPGMTTIIVLLLVQRRRS